MHYQYDLAELKVINDCIQITRQAGYIVSVL